MPEQVSALTLEFLAWVARHPRSYAEAMEAWRSHCPRHTVWEDALTDGLIQVEGGSSLRESRVTLTARGQALLHKDTSPGSSPNPRSSA
jgi:hypothetical protein